jgi:replicative DNA helicase
MSVAPIQRGTLPHNRGAERAVLGAILLRQSALNEVQALVAPDDFYEPAHRLIFSAMGEIDKAGGAIDPLTLSADLERREQLRKVEGGQAYLVQLLDDVPTAENASQYARIVRENATLRRLILVCREVASEAQGDHGDFREFLDAAESRIFHVAHQAEATDYTAVRKLLHEVIQNVERRREQGKDVTGIPTGFTDLDKMLAGLQPNDLVLLAARPSMGKTTLALSFALHASIHHKVPVLIFSLEMGKQQLVERMLCAEGRIDSAKLRSGFLQSHDFINLTKAASRVHEAPMYIDESSSPSVLEIRAKARRWASDPSVARAGAPFPGLIIVDYVQLVRAGGGARREDSREREISDVSRGLKALAKDLKMPVVALAQLNRGLEKREDKRPILSDLRESGALEQDADVICFIYRDEVYNKDRSDKKGIAEIIVGKHRNGPTGAIDLRFAGEHTRFDNLSMRDD